MEEKNEENSFSSCNDLTMCFALCACGATTATVTDNNGNVAEMTSKEILEVREENEMKFDELYVGAYTELLAYKN